MNDIYPRILADFSLETTAADAERFLRAAPCIPKGTQVKIAFLGNETFSQRLAAIETLCTIGADPMPIISARRLESAEALESYLTQAKQMGLVDSIFLVGGDPASPQGPFADSLDLISSNLLDRFDIGTIGIAGYPEGHPYIQDEVLWICLKRKIQQLTARGYAVEITTQLSFDVGRVLSWIEQVRCEGIHVPIRIGVPGPATVKGLLRFAGQCRVSTSLRLLRQYGWQVTSLLGTVGPERFLNALASELSRSDAGDVRLHVFPVGDLSSVARWLQGDKDATS